MGEASGYNGDGGFCLKEEARDDVEPSLEDMSIDALKAAMEKANGVHIVLASVGTTLSAHPPAPPELKGGTP